MKLNCSVCGNILIASGINFEVKSSSISTSSEMKFSLGICMKCHLFMNLDFLPNLVKYQDTEIKTYFSHYEQEQEVEKIISKLIDILPNKINRYFEFGCGDGLFMRSFLGKKSNKHFKEILGYDLDPHSSELITNNEEKVRDFLMNSPKTPTLVVARHVIEHMTDINEFFSLIKDLTNIVIYIEVPNGYEKVLNGGFEDLHYEHVSYFSSHSLKSMLVKYGFSVIEVFSSLGGENISVIGHKFLRELETNFVSSLVSNYNVFNNNILRLKELLNSEHTVFWGVGGRCRSILDRIGLIAEKNLKALLVDSDMLKVGQVYRGFDKPVSGPSSIYWKSIKKVVIGTRVGYKSILLELSEYNYEGKTVFWLDE